MNTPTNRRTFLSKLGLLICAPFVAKAATGPTTTEITNRLAAIDAQFAVSSQDLAEALRRAGIAANDAGVSFGQLVNHVTVAKDVTGRSGAAIGNSLKTIYTRIQRSEVATSLRSIGIEGATPGELLSSTVNRWSMLTAVERQFVAETLGGVFQTNIAKAIFATS